MARDSGALDEPAGAGLVPEGSEDRRFAFSRWSLAFVDPEVERAYVAYRSQTILRYLRILLVIGAVMVFAGSVVDHTRLGADAVLGLTLLRAAAAAGMLGALWLTFLPAVQARLQLFIGAGCVGINLIWLATAAIVGAGIVDYVGVLPIVIMLTFLVSGLMFRWARWVAPATLAAYAVALSVLHPTPLAPVFYMVATALYAGFAAYVAERARREAWADAEALSDEKARSEQLLLNVLPRSIADRMRAGEKLIADRYEDASVLFADICGFTEMSSRMPAEDLVDMLDEIFGRFDDIAARLDLEKIKTIGDCYMLAAGLPRERPMRTGRIADAALEMKAALRAVSEARGIPLDIRIGIHCGPVVAGVIGHSKFIYDLWGDTVNVASRMESTAPAGSIQVSDAMRQRLEAGFELEYGGERELKGRGIQPVYLLTGRRVA